MTLSRVVVFYKATDKVGGSLLFFVFIILNPRSCYFINYAYRLIIYVFLHQILLLSYLRTTSLLIKCYHWTSSKGFGQNQAWN